MDEFTEHANERPVITTPTSFGDKWSRKCRCGNSKAVEATMCVRCWRNSKQEKAVNKEHIEQGAILNEIDEVSAEKEVFEETQISLENEPVKEPVSEESSNIFPFDLKSIPNTKNFIIDGNKLLKIALASLTSGNLKEAFIDSIITDFLTQLKEPKND